MVLVNSDTIFYILYNLSKIHIIFMIKYYKFSKILRNYDIY